jgi:superfamily II DNA helicase RecQ
MCEECNKQEVAMAGQHIYSRIWEIKNRLQVQLVGCTATANEGAVEDISAYLKMHRPTVIRMPVVKSNLHICITEKGNSKQAEVSLVRMLRMSTSQTVIVFCCERKVCEHVTRLLCKNGLTAEAYHAGVKEREAVERRTRSGEHHCSMPVACCITHVV